jgi:hypothetical protein
MENNIKVNGKITKCMVRVHLIGLMEGFIQAIIIKIKNMVSVL